MKILIVKTSALGDIIHVFPVLQYLRKQCPQSQIDWVIEKPFQELVQAHPDIDQVLTVNTKKWRKSILKRETWKEIGSFLHTLRSNYYDLVFDLQGNFKSSLITMAVKSPLKVGFGRDSVPEWPNLLATNRRYNPPRGKNIREDYLFLAESVFENFQSGCEGVLLKIDAEEENKLDSLLRHPNLQKEKKIMVCVGSNWTNKRLPKESIKPFLAKIHREFGAGFLFIWGTMEEKSVAEELKADFKSCSIVVEKLKLPALQNLMSKLDLVIAMDSLPLHLAGTTSTPTFSLFGASLGKKYKPLGISHEVFQGRCPYGKTFDKRCPILRTCKTGSCIKEVDEEALYSQFKSWVKLKN